MSTASYLCPPEHWVLAGVVGLDNSLVFIQSSLLLLGGICAGHKHVVAGGSNDQQKYYSSCISISMYPCPRTFQIALLHDQRWYRWNVCRKHSELISPWADRSVLTVGFLLETPKELVMQRLCDAILLCRLAKSLFSAPGCMESCSNTMWSIWVWMEGGAVCFPSTARLWAELLLEK